MAEATATVEPKNLFGLELLLQAVLPTLRWPEPLLGGSLQEKSHFRAYDPSEYQVTSLMIIAS